MYNKELDRKEIHIYGIYPISIRQMIDRRRDMIGLWLILILYGIIGGLSTLFMVIGIPAIVVWKIYRKIVHHIPLSC